MRSILLDRFVLVNVLVVVNGLVLGHAHGHGLVLVSGTIV